MSWAPMAGGFAGSLASKGYYAATLFSLHCARKLERVMDLCLIQQGLRSGDGRAVCYIALLFSASRTPHVR